MERNVVSGINYLLIIIIFFKKNQTCRRRKLKRMAIDVTEQSGASTSTGIPSGSHAIPVIPHFSRSLPTRPSGSLPSAAALFKKRRVLRHSSNCDENRYVSAVIPKRNHVGVFIGDVISSLLD